VTGESGSGAVGGADGGADRGVGGSGGSSGAVGRRGSVVFTRSMM
jgi:hypothetical protein